VALDAGHGARAGGGHTGASANALVEDELALDMVKRVGHHLRAGGHETVYTRADRRLVALAKRAWTARFTRCELFLSIHCNAGPISAHGVEAFVVEGDARSRGLAERLASAVVAEGLSDRGVKWDNQSQHPRLAVLRGTYRRMPAVLLEIGFLTNAHDAGLLKQAAWRERVAKAIAGAI